MRANVTTPIPVPPRKRTRYGSTMRALPAIGVMATVSQYARLFHIRAAIAIPAGVYLLFRTRK
jgi:hypothetical protein